MVVCKCHKATQLYCCVHKVPVCGECICLSEHSTCEVRTYSEWVVDGSYNFPPKCSSCLEIFSNTSENIRLSCLHVLHTSCLLRLLKGSSSLTDHTCPSCNSEIWPPKQQVVSSDSTLCKQLEKLTRKNCATMSDGSFGAQLPFTCDLLPTVSNSSFQGISGTVYMTGTTVFSSSSPLVEINKDQTTQNFNFSGHSSHRENGERKSKPNAMEHIEAAKSSSPEIISTKTVESPKHTKVLSRKNSLRGDKETTEYPIEECGKESKYALKGPQTEYIGSLFSCNSPAKTILPLTSTHKITSKSVSVQGATEEQRHRYKRAASLDPRKILFFFATLSSMGTMILIYFILTVQKIGEGLV